MDPFVLRHTDILWAEIYRKRKNCIREPHEWFDRAAEINQPWKNILKNLDWQDEAVQNVFRELVDYVANVSDIDSSNHVYLAFQAMENNEPIFLKNLLEFGIRLQIETELGTTPFQTLKSMLVTLASEFQEGGLTAKRAVIHIMEATSLLPGVYNVQMLSWRQRLQEMVHCEGFLGSQNLNYKIELSREPACSISVASQTKLTNPNSDRLLEFEHPEYELKWVLVRK